jgi:ribokinase
MARILTLGPALQYIYLIDHDDLTATSIGSEAILGKILVGSEVEIDKIAYNVGGLGISSAVTFARHRHETILISNTGRDVASRAIFATLDYENIDSSYINQLPRDITGTSVILLDSKTGERTILTTAGASKHCDNLEENDINLIDPDWLYATTLYGDFTTLERFFKKARANKTKIAFKPGDQELADPQTLLRLLKYVDVLILNKVSAAKLVPGTILTELISHLSNYVKTVIITDGQMGGIATNHEETYRFGVYEDVRIKDITGAGEAIGAGFIAHLAADKSFRDSLIFASANAASVISKVGVNTGTLTGTEKLHPMPIQKI